MKIDKRQSDQRDLTSNYADYRSASSLMGHYRFYDRDARTNFPNLKPDWLADAAFEIDKVEAFPSQVYSSPYFGRNDLQSTKLEAQNLNSYRISYSDSAQKFVHTAPYTVSAWVKIPDIRVSGKTTILAKYRKNATSTSIQSEFEISYDHASGKIYFSIYGTGVYGTPGYSWSLRVPTQSLSSIIASDRWFHVTAVLIGSPAGDPITDWARIFINGLDKTAANSNVERYVYSGGIWSLQTTPRVFPVSFALNDFDGDVFVAKKDDSSSLGDATHYSSVLIHELALWNSNLKPPEILSIYETAVQKITSGIISESPRNILRSWDSLPEYPNISLPGDDRRLGNKQIKFDDFRQTRVFQSSSASGNLLIQYPTMIPKFGAPPGVGIDGAYATPNELPDIVVVSGEGVSSYAEFKSAYAQDLGSGRDLYSPFEDSRVDELGDKNYFSVPVAFGKSKITRALTTGFSGYNGETSPGVFYYSPNSNQFDIVGARDPATGYRYYKPGPLSTSSVATPAGYLRVTGPNQNRSSIFYNPPAETFGLLVNSASSDYNIFKEIFSSSFAAIGQPTMQFGGPANFRLYATSSNLIKMSNYINSPFEVESIEIELSGSVTKLFDKQFTGGYAADAYTFFLMRQSGGAEAKAVLTNISSSYRELISFNTILSWNAKNRWSGSYGDSVNSQSIKVDYTASADLFPNYDRYAYAVEYGVDGATYFGTKTESFKTKIDLTPRVAPANIHAINPSLNPDITWWGGASSNLHQFPSWYLTSGLSIQKYDFSAEGVDPNSKVPPFIQVDVRPNSMGGSAVRISNEGSTDGARQSARTTFPFAQRRYPVNKPRFGSGSFIVPEADVLNVDTRYLLFPGDNLIFGVNSAHSAPEAASKADSSSFWQTFSYSTGSYLELAEQETKIVFKGRYLSGGKKYHTSLPQQLNTAAIHESLHWQNPVLDQYELAPRSEYSGSLRSQYITGSMTNPASGWPRYSTVSNQNLRQVIGDFAAGTAADVTSIQRNVRLSDSSEIYYDSLVPDVSKMWKIDGYVLSSSVGPTTFSVYNVSLFNTTAPNTNENQVWLHRFPFEPRFSEVQRISKEKRGNFTEVVTYKLTNSPYSVWNGKDRPSSYYWNTIVSNISGIRKVRGSTEVNFQSAFGGTNNFATLEPSGRNIFFFGVGDGPYGMHTPAVRDTSGTYTKVVIEKPRGFKYGLIDANPKSTSAVFRATRYGQLRDMLEQRQYTALFDYESDFYPRLKTPGLTPYFEPKKAKVNKGVVSNSSAVEVRFRSPVHLAPTLNSTTVSPLLTSGSNMSLYATSSLPYFDDDTPRNRDYSGTI